MSHFFLYIDMFVKGRSDFQERGSYLNNGKRNNRIPPIYQLGKFGLKFQGLFLHFLEVQNFVEFCSRELKFVSTAVIQSRQSNV